jgi:hypothetical protein
MPYIKIRRRRARKARHYTEARFGVKAAIRTGSSNRGPNDAEQASELAIR